MTTTTAEPLDVKEVAAELGVPWKKVYDLIAGGTLRAFKNAAGEYRVKQSEVRRWRADALHEVGLQLEALAGAEGAAVFLRGWWKERMGEAQLEAVADAERFVALYRRLERDAKRGVANPDLAESFGRQSEQLISALLWFQACNDLYPKLAATVQQQVVNLTRGESVHA